MKKLLFSFAVAILVARSSTAADKTEVMAPVHQFIENFNKGDAKAAMACCTEQMSIIDDIPPHEWHGAGAFANWLNDYDADAKKNSITDGIVTLGKPRRVDSTADRGYVVVPATYTYKQNGKAVKETGAVLTVALKKTEAGWRITGWAWARH